MAVARDNSTLPRSAPAIDGVLPHAPRWGQALAAAWEQQSDHNDHKPHARDTPFRASDAGMCAHALGHKLIGSAVTGMDMSGHWNVGLGTIVHEKWQEVMPTLYPDAEFETTWDIDGVVSGSSDCVLVVERPTNGVLLPVKVVLEGKTIGGYGFKSAIGVQGNDVGPKHEHVIQLAMNVVGQDADEGTLIYWAKECLSATMLKKYLKREPGPEDEAQRFTAEWTFSRDYLEPIALAEVNRLRRVAKVVAEGRLPRRVIPSTDLPQGHVIVDPQATIDKGRWETRNDDGEVNGSGQWWGCGYCRYRSACTTMLEAGDPPLVAEDAA